MLVGYIDQTEELEGIIYQEDLLVGEISDFSGQVSSSDHEVVTIDLFQLNENNIIPIKANEVFTLADSEIQLITKNKVVTLAGSEIQPIKSNEVFNHETTVTQPETFQITMVSSNFEEDIEL